MNRIRLRALIAKQVRREFRMGAIEHPQGHEHPQVVAWYADGSGDRFDILGEGWICWAGKAGGRRVPAFHSARMQARFRRMAAVA